MLIAYFLDWSNVDSSCPVGVPSSFCTVPQLSGSDFFFRGTVPWILIVAVGVIATLLALGVMKPGKLPWSLVFLAASALGTLLVLIYLIHPTYSGFDSGRGIGSILGFLAAAAVLAGSFLGFKEGGGELNDLKDMNKLKSQFGGSSSVGATPPPPPGGGFTPPPPPPPAGGPPPPPPRA